MKCPSVSVLARFLFCFPGLFPFYGTSARTDRTVFLPRKHCRQHIYTTTSIPFFLLFSHEIHKREDEEKNKNQTGGRASSMGSKLLASCISVSVTTQDQASPGSGLSNQQRNANTTCVLCVCVSVCICVACFAQL
uniref:Putative secreted protein n=1 Tax=Anopheles darlingi TaxID=43151 RepID=A0A2M4DN24_ANODA